MPIIQSSIKDLRRTARRTARNKTAISALRTAVKKVRLKVAQRDAAAARTALAAAIPLLDRAAAKGLLHRNVVARTKSRLTQRVVTTTRCPFRKSCASDLLGAPGSSPAPEATLERGVPREHPGELAVHL